MVSEIKKGLSIHPTPGSITIETKTGDMLVKKDGNAQPSDESQTKSASSSSRAAEEKGRSIWKLLFGALRWNRI